MTFRLRFGPHAGQAAAQVVLNDPRYCLWWLAERPDSPLSEMLRDLVAAFDQLPFREPCCACGRGAHQAHVAAGSVELAPYCRACAVGATQVSPAYLVRTYEDALRHVAQTCPRGHRILMRRIIKRLALLKGGPQRLTEAAVVPWLAFRRPAATDRSEAGRSRPPQTLAERRPSQIPSPRWR